MTPMVRNRAWRGLLLGLSLLALTAGGLFAWGIASDRARVAALAKIRSVPVHREDLHLTLQAGGRIESAKRTLIECELENLKYSVDGGGAIRAQGRTSILEIVPDGTTVRRDDVLCRLDSSAYEELVRQQEIKLQQARNDHGKAELDLKAAAMALEEFREGSLPETVQALQGAVVLAESEISRQGDRLDWTSRMLKKGYVSEGQYAAEKQKMLRAEFNLKKLLGDRSVLDEFQGPIAIKTLEMRVDSARSDLAYQELRLRRTQQMLARFRHQVELCTIRAPHDGMVIYANEPDGDPRVEVGATVYQRMDLFYLPDLNELEVLTTLNESVVGRVRPGMAAHVRVEGKTGAEIEGHVVSVAPLPWLRRDLPFAGAVKNYLGKIRLHNSREKILPGMTAEVTIRTGEAGGALVIPTQALVAEQGKDYCYVAGQEGLERREVTLGRSTHDRLEICSGLQEGERVVEDPAALDDQALRLATVAEAPAHSDEPSESATE